jgi:DNA-binding LacI/PurR family transcriptional regulator
MQKLNRINSKVTAFDVAKAAGVSQSTVSRVLNNKAENFISKETRVRVLETARNLGYIPNPLAQALRMGKTNLVGIVLRDINDPLFALLVSELSIEMRNFGYHLLLINAQSDPQEALQMRSILDTRHTDGLIIMGDLPNGQEALQQVVESNDAVVSLYRKPYPGIGSVVTVDHYRGIELALTHLFELGHEKIGFLGYDWLDDIEYRQEAFVSIMDKNKKPTQPEWIQIGKGGIEGGYTTMKSMLQQQERPTAFVACDDTIAIGAVRAAAESGLVVSQDISIIGFDDIPLSKFITPPLTTIKMPVSSIAKKVSRLLIDFINKKSQPETKVYRIKPEVVIRGSTGPRKHKEH